MNNDDIKFQSLENKHSEIGYIVPFWSRKPTNKFSLDIWREGVITDTIDISNKEYYLIGRNKQVCDIYSNNMTNSRVHSVIQHKDDGSIFLYDLDSVYGTYLNKRLIAKKTYIRLNVGDTFKLGESSKMFILNGPSNAEDDVHDSSDTQIDTPAQTYIDRKTMIENKRKIVEEIYNQKEEYKKSLVNKEMNWGQRDDDLDIIQHQIEEEDKYESKKDSTEDEGKMNLEEIKERRDLSDKQRTMITKLENFRNGIKKLKDEIIKLKKKESDVGELTEGQKKKVEINEKKLTDLFEKYELQENNLKISLTSKDELDAEQKFDRKLAKELDSDDEYFDRTSKMNKTANSVSESNQPITENYETLKAKLENLIRTRQRLTDQLQKVDKEDKVSSAVEVDSLDLFFLQTENELTSGKKNVLTDQINDMTREISKTQKLLSLVTPSHIKIKYKTESELEIEKQINKENNLKLPFIKSDLPLKKKKVESVIESVNRLNKISNKIKEENLKKTDSDDEIIDEVEFFREQIGKEVEQDENFKRKIEDFKKNMNKKNTIDDSDERGGLILHKGKMDQMQDRNIVRENIFDDIVRNVSNVDFDLSNYEQINKFVNKKKEDRTNKKTIEIDFSTGGLQTFETGDKFSGQKRSREYGVTNKPQSRNVEEDFLEQDANDYDAIYTVGEKMGQEHNLDYNPYNKNMSDDF